MICPSCHNETDGASLFCHVCDTYRPAPGTGKKANVALRLLAHILDGLAVIAIFMTIVLVSCGIGAAGIQAGNAVNSESIAAAASLFGLGTFVFTLIAYVVLLLFFLVRGKTPGKAMCGIRVADKRNGNVPGIGRMLLRETLGKFVSGLFLGIGYFWAIFDRDGQAWHDKIAGTVVLKSPEKMVLPQPVVAPQTRAAAATSPGRQTLQRDGSVPLVEPRHFPAKRMLFGGLVVLAVALGVVITLSYFHGAPKQEPAVIVQGPLYSVPASVRVVNRKTASPANPTDLTSFYSEFRNAVYRRDTRVLHAMMSDSFEWATDGYVSREQAWKNVETDIRTQSFWQAAGNAVSGWPRMCSVAVCPSTDGYYVGTRTPMPFELIFRRDQNGIWHWSALLGG